MTSVGGIGKEQILSLVAGEAAKEYKIDTSFIDKINQLGACSNCLKPEEAAEYNKQLNNLREATVRFLREKANADANPNLSAFELYDLLTQIQHDGSAYKAPNFGELGQIIEDLGNSIKSGKVSQTVLFFNSAGLIVNATVSQKKPVTAAPVASNRNHVHARSFPPQSSCGESHGGVRLVSIPKRPAK